MTILPAHAASGQFVQPQTVHAADPRTVAEQPAEIDVPDLPGHALPSTIPVSGARGVVTDLAVVLGGVVHPNPDDLDILLVGPQGQRVVLLSDAGGTADANVSVLQLDDHAPAAAPDVAPFTGNRYRPANYAGGPDTYPVDAASAGTSLAAFNGTDPNGIWSLYVVDDTAGATGDLTDGWSLDITTNASALQERSQLSVSGLPYGITDVDVSLSGLEHEFPPDLDVGLVAPDGKQVLVMSDVGGSAPAGPLNLTFDDEATADLGRSTPLTSGRFRPSDDDGDGPDNNLPDTNGNNVQGSTLSFFDGIDPNGTWTLWAIDDFSSYHGRILSGWSLLITTADPPGAPIIATASHAQASSVVQLDGVVSAGATVTVRDNGVVVGEATATGDRWTAVMGTGQGRHRYTAVAQDVHGNVSPESAPVDILVDSTGPSGSLAINGGAARTNKRAVTLNLTGTDGSEGSGVASMQFSPDGTTFSTPEPFAATKRLLIGSSNGTRRVFVRLLDTLGNASATFDDSIVLDTHGPKAHRLTPARNKAQVKPTKSVSVTFSEAVLPRTLTRRTVRLVPVGSKKAVKASVRYNTKKKTVVLNPRKRLSTKTGYTVTVATSVLDLAGNRLDASPKRAGSQQVTWRFTTRKG